MIPFSKCCNSQVIVNLSNNCLGNVICNSNSCNMSVLDQF